MNILLGKPIGEKKKKKNCLFTLEIQNWTSLRRDDRV